jgi:hypothetical protein
MSAPVAANSNLSPAAQAAARREWELARRPRLVADAGADPLAAAFLAARAAVAARRRDLAAGLVGGPVQ